MGRKKKHTHTDELMGTDGRRLLSLVLEEIEFHLLGTGHFAPSTITCNHRWDTGGKAINSVAIWMQLFNAKKMAESWTKIIDLLKTFTILYESSPSRFLSFVLERYSHAGISALCFRTQNNQDKELLTIKAKKWVCILRLRLANHKHSNFPSLHSLHSQS